MNCEVNRVELTFNGEEGEIIGMKPEKIDYGAMPHVVYQLVNTLADIEKLSTQDEKEMRLIAFAHYCVKAYEHDDEAVIADQDGDAYIERLVIAHENYFLEHPEKASTIGDL